MAEKQLKSFYNQAVVEDIAANIAAIQNNFKVSVFTAEIMHDLPDLELKGRSLRIAQAMKVHLQKSFPEAIKILLISMGKDNGSGGMEGMSGFRYLPFINYVGLYGLEYPETSLAALKHMTLYFSAELDIRYFIIKHYEASMDEIGKWVQESSLFKLCTWLQ